MHLILSEAIAHTVYVFRVGVVLRRSTRAHRCRIDRRKASQYDSKTNNSSRKTQKATDSTHTRLPRQYEQYKRTFCTWLSLGGADQDTVGKMSDFTTRAQEKMRDCEAYAEAHNLSRCHLRRDYDALDLRATSSDSSTISHHGDFQGHLMANWCTHGRSNTTTRIF